jgi:hypothetical protein
MMSSMDDVTVDIADVFADAVRVPAESVKAGDLVFDAFGGRHEVKSAKSTTVRGVSGVRILRHDGWPIYLEHGDTITIVRAR